MIRKAVFAYEWYPGEPKVLRSTIKSYLGDCRVSENIFGVISPHAGYIYSGHVAGAVYSHVKVPEVVVILCVNHRGIGARAAIISSGLWETPLGQVSIQEDLAETIKNNAPVVEEDPTAHMREHSLELQLPFLQYLNPQFQLVPIALQHLSYEECEQLGIGLANSVQRFQKQVVLVASNDMTHFEPQEVAERKDRMAINKILEIDPYGLYTTVQRNRISMCGVIPSTVLLSSCKHLGARKGKLIKYASSGEVSKDYSSVVGYAGILLQ